ncbi:MAG TPA: FprA family A-type flavoprotein, partial [Deltaproteobacteria bacterium]|nr:FprA family A-type flavoprotein [Deltaproteobacteria bacterium]
MNKIFKAVKVSDRVYWVGAIDWNIRDFHGYTTKRGTTYNAYLILADTITLIDTVRAPFKDEMLARIRSLIEPTDIQYIISDHSEMDHTGSLPGVITEISPERIFASTMGVKTLGEMYHLDRKIEPLSDGSSLDLGNMTLTFYETRMLHWPDSMFSYLSNENILFSHDAFGMHLATSERFADEIDGAILDYEAATYFANILLPYSPLILKLLDKVGSMGLACDVIAPDHGPMWRSDMRKIIDYYRTWALQEPKRKAVVLYDTMWHSTELMARAVSEGLASTGISVRNMSMHANHRSDVAYEILDAGALVVGSPTLNNNLFPTIADILTYLKGLRPRNLVGGVFGSYGWSGESIRHVHG